MFSSQPTVLLLLVFILDPPRACGAQLRAKASKLAPSEEGNGHPRRKRHRHHHHHHHDQSLESQASYRQSLQNNWDVQYAATVEVGGQKLSTVVDTGSFELLVFSERCLSCGTTRGLYSEKLSHTFNSTGDFIGEHNFGSGTTKSHEAYETVKIGPFKSRSQHFWEVVSADMPILEDDYFHAILGMGPPSSAEKFAEINADDVHQEVDEYLRTHDGLPRSVEEEVQHYDDTVEHLRKATSLTESLGLDNVSICLGKGPGSEGVFVWNDHSTRDEPAKFTSIDVVGDVYWSANLTSVRLSGGTTTTHLRQPLPLGCNASEMCTAVVDTGTSLIVAPAEVIEQVQDLLDKWVDPTGDCSDVAGFPTLDFELNGNFFSLPPESYIGKVSGDIDENIQRMMPQLRQEKPALEDSDRCVPLLMAGEADSQFGELWILGMPFFRKFYTTFHFADHGEKASAMSFAVAGDGCRPDWPEDALLRAQEVARPHREPFHLDASKLRMPRLLEQRQSKDRIREQLRAEDPLRAQILLEERIPERRRVHI